MQSSLTFLILLSLVSFGSPLRVSAASQGETAIPAPCSRTVKQLLGEKGAIEQVLYDRIVRSIDEKDNTRTCFLYQSWDSLISMALLEAERCLDDITTQQLTSELAEVGGIMGSLGCQQILPK